MRLSARPTENFVFGSGAVCCPCRPSAYPPALHGKFALFAMLTNSGLNDKMYSDFKSPTNRIRGCPTLKSAEMRGSPCEPFNLIRVMPS